MEVRGVDLVNWALRISPKFPTGVEYQIHQGFWPDQRSGNPNQNSPLTLYIYRVLKNNVYNVSGMIENAKTNMFFIWQNFGLCTVLPLDDLTGRYLDFRHNTHRLVLFVLLCLQQVERVITVPTKTCYDKYSKYVCVYFHSRATAYLQCWNMFTFVLYGGFHLL